MQDTTILRERETGGLDAGVGRGLSGLIVDIQSNGDFCSQMPVLIKPATTVKRNKILI